MNAVLKPDLANFITVGLIAFVGVWAINRAIKLSPLPDSWAV